MSGTEVFATILLAVVAIETAWAYRISRRIRSRAPVFVVLVRSRPSSDYYPITVCRTGKLAQQYRDGLSRLPVGHPLRVDLVDSFVDPVPLLSRLPDPLVDVV